MFPFKFLVFAAALAASGECCVLHKPIPKGVLNALLAAAAPAKGPHADYVTTLTQVFDGHTTTEVWTIDPPGSFPTGGTAGTNDVPATVTQVSPVI